MNRSMRSALRWPTAPTTARPKATTSSLDASTAKFAKGTGRYVTVEATKNTVCLSSVQHIGGGGSWKSLARVCAGGGVAYRTRQDAPEHKQTTRRQRSSRGTSAGPMRTSPTRHSQKAFLSTVYAHNEQTLSLDRLRMSS